MLSDRMVTAGHTLFRWRSYLLFAFLPLFVWAAWDGETIETTWGDALGDSVEALALALVMLGESIRILTVGFVPRGTSGRNTTGQVADSLNTTGLYSLTRNPLYLGNCLMYAGLALYTQHLWIVAVLILVLALYYERIIAAEESFLTEKFGTPYTDWAATTPPFWPRLSGFKRPGLSFSVLSVIRREHASILGAYAAVYLLELGLHSLPANSEPMASGWHWALAAAVGLEIIVIAIKRKTTLLTVEGR
ncbi:methyltransferase family protein [Pararhodobacter zhoushanensis]|uniref:Isoprenylcysteine carboxylmethyltransferase family protein n=1 Tax=Pararhodobacter zhoushanensis TaxID=2479545 RepID=A0ABT3H2K8_9RHOB|nr:isoprenylcysteine carboxylmethyltransferase family protein [Pararhodobacter zhoushanensis]MCW1934076.1 isoprenylcysteine carboxylmethyltransferase family protein [Pararhodobacter zhoushanensis]